MADSIRPNIDSREAFSDMEQMAYEDAKSHMAAYPKLDDDYDDEEDWEEFEEYLDSVEEDEDYYDEEYDGQPDEYTEWQDYYGGDDWDQGQYDEY